jgi:hypothetical protein
LNVFFINFTNKTDSKFGSGRLNNIKFQSKSMGLKKALRRLYKNKFTNGPVFWVP